MLGDDELGALAADIAANGLHQPIVTTPAGLVLDGRNRLAACERAGVEPTFVVYDGDPVAYVLSANEHRRHLTPSQRAMLIVKVHQASGAEYSARGAGVAAGVNNAMVVHARKVAQHAPELVDAVVAGTIPVKRAADEADRLRSVRKRSAAEQVDNLRWLTYVRSGFPDLAEAFSAGEKTREQVDDDIKGLEVHATTVPRDCVNRVVAAFAVLREEVATLEVMADRWALGDHAERLPGSSDFAGLAAAIGRVTKGDSQ
jgi:hypothetical protein